MIVVPGITAVIFGVSWGVRVAAALGAIVVMAMLVFLCWGLPRVWRNTRSLFAMGLLVVAIVGALLGTVGLSWVVIRSPDRSAPEWVWQMSLTGAVCWVIGMFGAPSVVRSQRRHK